MRSRKLAPLFAALLLCAAPSHAGPGDSAARTQEYHAAYTAFESNDMQRAYRILTALVAKNPAFDAVTLLGQAELNLEKYRDAATHLEFALRHTPKAKLDVAGPMIRMDLAEAKKHIVSLTVKVIQAGADITIDGELIGRSPLGHEVYVEPQRHTIRATHPTLGSAEMSMDFRAGEDLPITLRLKPLTEEVSADAAEKPRSEVEDSNQPTKTSAPPQPPAENANGLETKTVFLVVGGVVTVAAGITATVFGIRRSSAAGDADALLRSAEQQYGANPCWNASSSERPICGNISNRTSDRDNAGRVFNVMLPVALGSALATGLLYVLWPSNSAGSARQTWLIPTAYRDFGGLAVLGSF
jgi:hypothetical protein